METEQNDLPEVFFSDFETSEEVHDRLFKEIKALQTPEECREFYDSPRFNNCLQNLRNAQLRFTDSYEENRDDWAKMWALAKSSGSSRTREQANSYDRDRKVCLKLLYRVCDLCFREPPTEDTVPSLKTRSIWPWNDDGVDGLNGLVKAFELRRITAIVVRCLPMDRANALYHMRNDASEGELYRCWLGHHHVNENGPKLQNKRFWWLLSTEELVFGPQERNRMEKWLLQARANPDDFTPVNWSEYSVNEKNVVILIDGTGKHIKDEKCSNVVKLLELLDEDYTHYVHGLGRFAMDDWNPADSRRKLHELAGGRGISDKILEAYTYLVSNYMNGCRIFVFGFSRGAHIARILSALINTIGVIAKADDVPKAVDAFLSPKRDARAVAATLRTRDAKVHFLGIWDTVGKKDDETKRDASMAYLRHALAIDERRYYFRPSLCTISSNANVDTKQVWFVGCHGDVGGGHNEKKSGFSDISLEWMLSEASQAGLPLKDDWQSSRSSTEIHRIPYSESLKSWWWLCELIPRKSRKKDLKGEETRCRYRYPTLGPRRRRMPKDDTIHESVRDRLRENKEYRPKNLLAYLELNGVQVTASGLETRRAEKNLERYPA